MSRSKLVRDNAFPEEVHRSWAVDCRIGDSSAHHKSKHSKGKTSPTKKKKGKRK